jgi:RecA/RadA recombinase
MSELKDFLKKKLKRGVRSGSELGYIERFSTGIAGLDFVLGGGIPKRRITQIWGSPSVGKSALTLNIIRGLQEKNSGAEFLYVDAEGTITEQDLEVNRIDKERVIFFEPIGGEEAIDAAVEAIEAGAQLVVIDSVPFLRPKKVLEQIKNDSTYRDISGIAQLIERVQHKLVSTLEHNDGALIFINQERPPKDIYSLPSFPGGTALSFMLSCNVHIQRAKRDKENPERITQSVIVRKNKTYTPMLQTELSMTNRVVERGKSLGDIAAQLGLIIQKAGGHNNLKTEIAELLKRNTTLPRGLEALGPYLDEDTELYNYLYTQVLESLERNVGVSLKVESEDEEDLPDIFKNVPEED